MINRGALLILALSIAASTIARGDSTSAAIAVEIGITPEAVVLADLQDMATTLLDRVSGEQELRTAVVLSRAEVEQATQEVATLSNELRQTPDDSAIATELEAASVALSVSRADYQTARNDLFDWVTLEVQPTQRAMLLARRTAARYRVPASFGVLDRTDDEWRVIEQACRIERRALARSEPVEPAVAGLLLGIRMEQAVAEAETRIAFFLAPVRATFAEHN